MLVLVLVLEIATPRVDHEQEREHDYEIAKSPLDASGELGYKERTPHAAFPHCTMREHSVRATDSVLRCLRMDATVDRDWRTPQRDVPPKAPPPRDFRPDAGREKDALFCPYSVHPRSGYEILSRRSPRSVVEADNGRAGKGEAQSRATFTSLKRVAALALSLR